MYKLGALGGTFDFLHQGHKEFIKFALSKAEKVVIGLTTDSYVKKNKPQKNIASFIDRQNSLLFFLNEIGAASKVTIVSLDNVFGPTLNPDYLLDALFVTSDSKKSGMEVNKKRMELGLLPLFLEVFDLVKSPSGSIISSTVIRKEVLTLPDTLRAVLQKPFGSVLSELPHNPDHSKTITVGDATTKRFLDGHIEPFLAIVDNKIERKDVSEIEFKNRKIYSVKNSASTISSELVSAISKSLAEKRKSVIKVEGEEDLAVLPVIENAPLGFTVYYGQPHVGLVEVVVSEEIKNKVKDILSRFD